MLLDSSRDPHDCSRLISPQISQGGGGRHIAGQSFWRGGGAILSTLTRCVIRLQERHTHTHRTSLLHLGLSQELSEEKAK